MNDKLATFERKILKTINGSINNTETRKYERRTNAGIERALYPNDWNGETSFIF